MSWIERIFLKAMPLYQMRFLSDRSAEFLQATINRHCYQIFRASRALAEKTPPPASLEFGKVPPVLREIQTLAPALSASPYAVPQLSRKLIRESVELAMIAGSTPDELQQIVNETIEEKRYIYDAS